VAAALAIIPGLGHIYLGHTAKGVAYMLGAGGLEFIGLDLDATLVLAPLGIPAGLGGLGLWAHGIFDAYRTAKQMQADGTL
jgi:TM2 domain-containing membrane protein YozV